MFAWAAAQVKKAMEATKELGGEGYVFWGGGRLRLRASLLLAKSSRWPAPPPAPEACLMCPAWLPARGRRPRGCQRLLATAASLRACLLLHRPPGGLPAPSGHLLLAHARLCRAGGLPEACWGRACRSAAPASTLHACCTGREGYQSLLGTDLPLELGHLAAFLRMAAAYKKRLGLEAQLMLEPKPQARLGGRVAGWGPHTPSQLAVPLAVWRSPGRLLVGCRG